MKTTAQQKHDQSMENLICIAVDGRMDKDTLLHKEICEENGQETMKKTKGPERHLTFTKETSYESKYLTVLPNIGATGAGCFAWIQQWEDYQGYPCWQH